ncbi:MAG: thioredoxin family protein [Actinobacteria bacterium]|nr:MAG: thioredoxin family protein [Actinomycetota bacterium]
MLIKILGVGCANCKRLEELTRQAAANAGVEARFEKVDDFKDIASYGVLSTPALVVDEQVKLAGRVPSAGELEQILKEAASAE